MDNFLEKKLKDKDFVSAFLTSLLAIIIILLVLGVVAWNFRGNIFGFFAREYLKEEAAANSNSNNAPTFSQDSFVVDAVKKTNPAVVSIVISKEVPKYEVDPNAQQNNPFGNMFPGFNFNFGTPQYKQNGTEKKDIGSGSGFLVSADGLIVTNKHVVDQQGATYTAFTNDGKKHDAKVIAKDPVLDIALIKIDGTDLPYLTLGNSDALNLGQSVIAIGNALGEFRNTVSVGVISGLARSITAGDSTGNSELLDHVIQTDAAINPGNSGGPLLDLSGNVIGVDVAVAQGSQSIGFALPINSVKGAIESVKATGKIIRPYLGVRYTAIDAELKDKNNLSVDYGVLVKPGATASELAVIPGGPADKAGIVENDIILEIDGVKLDDKTTLASQVRSKTVGQVVTLKILHKGEEKNVQVTLEAAPEAK
ncbi:MAG: trypsin-like peptidase domain-containing protein [Patescibacteria group bacterium]